jgi:hypothetical protein
MEHVWVWKIITDIFPVLAGAGSSDRLRESDYIIKY